MRVACRRRAAAASGPWRSAWMARLQDVRLLRTSIAPAAVRREKKPVEAFLLAPAAPHGRPTVPAHIPRPPYAREGAETVPPSMLEQPQVAEIKDDAAIAKMRASCRLARRMLDLAGSLVRPGVTTNAIDAAVHDAIVAEGAYPSPLGYPGMAGTRFPKSLCTSVNEVLLHGIPDDRPLEDGDIVNIDVTVYLDGYHGDCSRTFLVGNVDSHARRLVNTNEECVAEVISQLRPGMDLRIIGSFVEDYANKAGYAVFPEAAGHGIGSVFHAFPPILHFRNELSLKLKPGMTFTIEPVFVEKEPAFYLWSDLWTLSTKDGGWSAQTEHTVLITPSGAEILTSP